MNKLIPILALFLMSFSSTLVFADPTEEANAIVNKWSAAYILNDPEALVKLYAHDAILLGTVSPVISIGTEAIQNYFSRLKGSENKAVIQEQRIITLGEEGAVVKGLYEFTSLKDGNLPPRLLQFTMLVTKRNGEWHIVHHGSSSGAIPKN